jgi:hypothetical protein
VTTRFTGRPPVGSTLGRVFRIRTIAASGCPRPT